MTAHKPIKVVVRQAIITIATVMSLTTLSAQNNPGEVPSAASALLDAQLGDATQEDATADTSTVQQPSTYLTANESVKPEVPSTPRPLDVSRNIQPEGWNWYKDPILSPKQKDSPKASPPQQILSTRPQPKPSKAPPKTAKERVKEMRERLEEQTAQAILDPTIANVQAVQKSQNQILDMSGKFETAWMASSLASGVGFDHESNPTPANRVLVDADKIAFTTGNLKAMSKKFGLFFCIKKGCQYCTAFAPVVKDFAQKYGFSVLTISKNGETIKGFDGVSDNGLLDKINPRGGYPALFLVSYDKTSILPIAWGFVNLQELEQNAWWILKQQKAGL